MLTYEDVSVTITVLVCVCSNKFQKLHPIPSWYRWLAHLTLTQETGVRVPVTELFCCCRLFFWSCENLYTATDTGIAIYGFECGIEAFLVQLKSGVLILRRPMNSDRDSSIAIYSL